MCEFKDINTNLKPHNVKRTERPSTFPKVIMNKENEENGGEISRVFIISVSRENDSSAILAHSQCQTSITPPISFSAASSTYS